MSVATAASSIETARSALAETVSAAVAASAITPVILNIELT